MEKQEIRIETFTDMSFGTNTYVISLAGSENAVVVDPGFSANAVLRHLEENNIKLEAVLLTHSHPDHLAESKPIIDKTGADIYLHPEDMGEANNMPQMYLRMLGLSSLDLPTEFKPLKDEEILEIAGMKIKVLHTPGHSPGSVSFLIGDSLFDGDLVFRSSIGRTDFPGGDFETLIRSVREKIFTLDDATKIYPGHMGTTTVGYERKTNPFLLGI